MDLNDLTADMLRGGEPPMSPKCRPCTAGDHYRCATVLGPEYGGVFDTTYRCPCFHADRESHEADYDLNQADRDFNRSTHPLLDERPYIDWDD